MMAFLKNKTDFYQWDLDQKLIVTDPDVNEVHFCNQTEECALVCEVYTEVENRLVNVPNILLQTCWPITAYAHSDGATKGSQTFEVKARSKPADYVYTETEIKNWSDLDARLKVLEAGGTPGPGGGGQVELAFDGEYNAETNKVATVQTVVNQVKPLTKKTEALEAKAQALEDTFNDTLGDISTALDELHAYAETVISGGGS